MKYLQSYNESLRDKMSPKPIDDIVLSLKNKLNISTDYIKVKLPEPKEVKDIKSLIEISDKFDVDIEDYNDNNVLISGNIFNTYQFFHLYLNYKMLNKRNSRTFHMDYIKNNIVNE